MAAVSLSRRWLANRSISTPRIAHAAFKYWSASRAGRSIPQHVHMHVIEPGDATYWIDSLVFSDDPLLSEADRRDARDARGGGGLVVPVEDGSGFWTVRRDIALGLGVPGYGR